MLFSPSREEARNFLHEAWRKRKSGAVLSPLEDLTAQLIEKHPEYHNVVEDPQASQNKDYLPEHGTPNPFLHLMMHLTLEEQISIDQPRGIRAHFLRLTRKFGSEHDAQHRMMDCLGEMIWKAQHSGSQLDQAVYFDCLDRQ